MDMIKSWSFIFMLLQIIFQTSSTVYGFLRHNETNNYVKKVNVLCPNELLNNEAGRIGLYFNSSDIHIIKSIEKQYFSHCGAWCLFDYRDPTKGWFWIKEERYWKYHDNLYKLCPLEEFRYAVKQYITDCQNKN